MSETNISQSNEPLPPDYKIIVGDTVFEPQLLEQTTRHKLLGRVGLRRNNEPTPEQQATSKKEFIFSVVDSLQDTSYSIPEVTKNKLPLTEQDYGLFGYVPAELRFSAEDEHFHKENDPTLDGLKKDGYDWFRIAEDSQGSTFFLKSAVRQNRADYQNSIYMLLQAATMSQEVYAANIAKAVGYPVPEIKRLMWQGKPWLASAFVKNHVHTSAYVGPSVPIQNAAAYNIRPLFNMLIAASGDSAHQGIIDPKTGMYFAQDTHTHFLQEELQRTPQQLAEEFIASARGDRKLGNNYVPDYGSLTALSVQEKQFAHTMLQKALALNAAQAAEIFAFGRGMYKQSGQLLNHIKNRALAVEQVLHTVPTSKIL